MKYYANFLIRNTKNKIDTALGSDGTLILDGRHSLPRMESCAYSHAYKLRFIHNYIGFQIRKGDRFKDTNPIVSNVHFSYKAVTD